MRIESRPRRSGKTTELVKWVTDPDTEEDRAILCLTSRDATDMRRNHRLSRDQVVSVDRPETYQGRRPVLRVEEGEQLIRLALRHLGVDHLEVEQVYVLADDSIPPGAWT